MRKRHPCCERQLSARSDFIFTRSQRLSRLHCYALIVALPASESRSAILEEGEHKVPHHTPFVPRIYRLSHHSRASSGELSPGVALVLVPSLATLNRSLCVIHHLFLTGSRSLFVHLTRNSPLLFVLLPLVLYCTCHVPTASTDQQEGKS